LEKESEEMTAVWRKELAVIQSAKELNEKIEVTKMLIVLSKNKS